MALGEVEKDPVDTCPLSIDFTKWSQGLDLSSVSWSTDSADVTLINTTLNGKVAKTMVTGGILGEDYKVYCTATRADGAIKRESVIINMQET